MSNIIDFIVDGVQFASRTWDNVPRVGDTVILQNGKTWVEVEKVIWADDSGTPRSMERQWIQLVCKKVDSLSPEQ